MSTWIAIWGHAGLSAPPECPTLGRFGALRTACIFLFRSSYPGLFDLSSRQSQVMWPLHGRAPECAPSIACWSSAIRSARDDSVAQRYEVLASSSSYLRSRKRQMKGGSYPAIESGIHAKKQRPWTYMALSSHHLALIDGCPGRIFLDRHDPPNAIPGLFSP